MKNIPKELIQHKQWVLWKTIRRDGQSTKLPFQYHGAPAKSNDPDTWQDLAVILSNLDGYEGPGFVFTADDPFIGVDLDGCRNPYTGEYSEWAREIIQRFDTYSELSPSKAGVKLFLKGEWCFEGGRKCTVDAESVSPKEPGIEVYAEKRYFTVTGQKLKGLPSSIEQRQEALGWLVDKYFKQSCEPAAESAPLFTDDQIIKRARNYLEKIPPRRERRARARPNIPRCLRAGARFRPS